MEVSGSNRYLRPAVLIVICLLHGSLIVVLVRTKTLRRTSEPVATIYLIIPELKNRRLPHNENALAPHLLRTEPPRFLRESTCHGLKLRIPVGIPSKIIDHCFIELGQTNLDQSNLGQTPSAPEQRLQIRCALRKQPARGDLFDSLRKEKPQE
jgi:hypothetical protein